MCAQSSPSLSDLMDCSPPGSSVHGTFQARILEWVAISFSRGSSPPGIGPSFPALAGEFFTTEPPRKQSDCSFGSSDQIVSSQGAAEALVILPVLLLYRQVKFVAMH